MIQTLNILDEGPNIAIKQDKKFLDGMDEWNTTQHTSSGLLDSVLQCCKHKRSRN